MTQKDLDRQQAKWVQSLSQFDIDIVYTPSRLNPADALSRHPLHRLAAVSLVQTSPELLQEFAEANEADPQYRSSDPGRIGSGTDSPTSGPTVPGRIGSRTDDPTLGPTVDGGVDSPPAAGPMGCKKQGPLLLQHRVLHA